MLINVKCFGAGLNTTLYVDVGPKQTVGDLIHQVQVFRPDIAVKRLLFAGKQLSDHGSSLGK